MAEISSAEAWILRLQESDRIFYQKINEIRAQMGMPPAKPPSYDNKKQDAEPVILHPEACGSRLQSMELEANSEEQGRYSTMELEVGEEATQPDAMEDNSLTILGPILEDSSGEFSGIDGTDECQSTSLLFEPPIVQSTVFNGDAMGLNRPSFLEGFKSENPSNPRLNPTPSNLGVRLNCVELGKEDHGVNGSRVLHTEMNNSMEESTPQVVPSKVVQVTKESFVEAYHLFDEMPKDKVEVFQHSKVIFVPLVVSKMGCVDSERAYDDIGDVFAHSIDLTRSRADDGEPKSTDSSGLFVFDPGKGIRFLLHSGEIEALVIFVFDPGISCKV